MDLIGNGAVFYKGLVYYKPLPTENSKHETKVKFVIPFFEQSSRIGAL